MAFVYQVRFEIQPEEMSHLEIGASLERVLSYLRSLLPNQTGFVTARAMYSVDDPKETHLIFHSVWETWSDLQGHRASRLSEEKVLTEFRPHVSMHDLSFDTFEEVA